MTQRDAFMQAIIENIDEDAPRLIFADWLDEQGDSDRADFIRIQCEREHLGNEHPRRGNLFNLLRHRQRRLIVRCHPRFAREDLGPLADPVKCLRAYRRGFVAEISLSCLTWLAHREALLRSTPLEKVTLLQSAVPALNASWQYEVSGDHPVVLRRNERGRIIDLFGRLVDVSFPPQPVSQKEQDADFF